MNRGTLEDALDRRTRGTVPLGARERRDAARLGGATVAAILAQFLVDAPGGLFGSRQEITLFGTVYAVLALAGGVLGVAAILGRWRRSGAVGMALSAVHVGAFIAPLASDPVIAGVVVAWNLVLLGDLAFRRPMAGDAGSGTVRDADPLARWERINGPAARVLLALSLVVGVGVSGYRLGHHLPAQLVSAAVACVAVAFTAPLPRLLVRHGSRMALLLAAPLALAPPAIVLAPASQRIAVALGLVTVYQGALMAVLAARTSLASELMRAFLDRPARLLLASFAVLIGLGTLLLSFPASTSSGEAMAPLDALFTATSASCVTGLVVLDTAGELSRFGQVVVLLLIQAGGLNIMVLTGFAAILLGHGLGLRGETALGEVINAPHVHSARRLTVFIVLSTLAIEAAGGLLLWWSFARAGEGVGVACFKGVFHAVSAVCNAGFALQADSLVRYQSDPAILLVVALLIVLGGLGFPVLLALWRAARRRPGPRGDVQVRLALAVSAALLLAGAVWFAAAEWGRSLEGLAVGDKLLNALFQSVTLRTAGFNSVDLAALHPATLLVSMALMLVGASPGGTGGGIKTTTLAVLLGAIPAIARGEARIVLFRRTVSLDTVYRSAAIVTVTALIALLAALALLASQHQPFEVLLFEVVSAVGTVGLSLGATPELDATGKLVIAVVMLVGRIGPLSLVLLMGRAAVGRVTYPESPIIVG